MEAIRIHEFGDPGVMNLESCPDLQAGRGQILVDLQAAGVNPVDTYIRAGTYAMKPDLPFTPGMDGAGTVAAVGDDTAHVSAGDRVYLAGTLTGTYAFQAFCSRNQVHPLPENVSFAQARGYTCRTPLLARLFSGRRAGPANRTRSRRQWRSGIGPYNCAGGRHDGHRDGRFRAGRGPGIGTGRPSRGRSS